MKYLAISQRATTRPMEPKMENMVISSIRQQLPPCLKDKLQLYNFQPPRNTWCGGWLGVWWTTPLGIKTRDSGGGGGGGGGGDGGNIVGGNDHRRC